MNRLWLLAGIVGMGLSYVACSASGALLDGGATTGEDGGQTPVGDGGMPVGDGGVMVGFTRGPSGCAPLTVAANVNVGGYPSERYSWSDGACKPRSAALVHNNAADPGGSRGGFLRELSWRLGSTEVVARGTGNSNWNGWGYVVNHYADTADVSSTRTGTYRTVLAGAHHALHEFKVRMSPGGPVDVTIHWFFATGRSNPVYAITYDATPAGANAVNADTRAPYGDLAFEGTEGEIAGVAWGDGYKFTTTGAGPVTVSTPWDYTQKNTVPFTRMWSSAVDAELGAVQTQTFEQHVAGGDYGGGVVPTDCWGKTSATRGPGCSAAGEVMPKNYLWPFQLNNYELPFTATSHRFAWGSSFGAIGQTTASAFGKTFPGYPRVSYSVFMVVGQRTANATAAQVTGVEVLTSASLTASVGTVATSGPAGVGRTDTATYAPAGYDPIFATWNVATAAGRATVTLDPKGRSLSAPVFRFTGFTAAQVSQVTLNGSATSDYFATVDGATQTLWLTLNGTVSAPLTLHVE